jgi:hypothetical protein
LAKNATVASTVASLNFGWYSERVEAVQGHEPILDVDASAHFLDAADQHAHRALPDLLE